ncbi:hypothetical protein V6N12_035182 [Hibiscus sabdariffa]|uniref:Uncharacterized protein n=1 Tax=Hibiscus sabdariffa TaxID=183260 RepID=A0ABR1Z7S9_9ROSI
MFDELSMPTEEVSDGFDDSTVVSLEDDLIKGSSETQQLDEMLVSMGEASNANVGDIIVQLQDNMDPIDLVNMLVGCEDQFSVVQFVNQVNFHRNHLFSEYKNPVTSTWIDKFQVKQKPLLNLLRVMTHMGLLLMDENDFSRSISLAKERASSVVQNTVGMRKRQLKQKDIHISGDNTKVCTLPASTRILESTKMENKECLFYVDECLNMVLKCGDFLKCWKDIHTTIRWKLVNSMYHRAPILFERNDNHLGTLEELGLQFTRFSQSFLQMSLENSSLVFEYRARVGGVQFELPKLGTSLGCA